MIVDMDKLCVSYKMKNDENLGVAFEDIEETNIKLDSQHVMRKDAIYFYHIQI